MSVKSESIQSKKDSGQDERLKKISPLRVLLNRPELGALGGSILVFIFKINLSLSSVKCDLLYSLLERISLSIDADTKGSDDSN